MSDIIIVLICSGITALATGLDIPLYFIEKIQPARWAILIEESKTERYKQVLSASNAPLVSSDILQSSFASIVDLEMTRVVDGDLIKIMAWYDNEWGFTNQMIREIQLI